MRRRQNATEWEVSLMRHGHIGHGTFGTFCNETQSGWPRLSSKIRWGSSEGCVLRWIEHRICCPDIPGTFSRFHAPSIFLRFHDCLEHAYIFFRYTDTRSTLTPKTCFFCFFYSSCTLDHKILRPDESGLSLGTVDQGGDVVSSFFIRWQTKRHTSINTHEWFTWVLMVINHPFMDINGMLMECSWNVNGMLMVINHPSH